MKAITLIFPHQLFQAHPAVQAGRTVYLLEEALYFTQYNFHQKKILLHRASMQYYADWLRKKGLTVKYVDAVEKESDITAFIQSLPASINEIHYADVVDDWLQQRLQKAAAKSKRALVSYLTPMFINSGEELDAYFDQHPKYFQTHFYTYQRKQRNLLLEKDGGPLGGKWSFDEENRQRLPKGAKLPVLTLPHNRKYVPDAIQYVQKHFGNNYGNTEPPFFKQHGFYPVTHAEAKTWLEAFLSTRFAHFGAYEDAIVPGEALLYHSCITPMLNTGLLTPKQVLDAALDAASEQEIPLNSLEGFMRQLIGWREFIRAVYLREGVQQRTKNHWGFTRKIPSSFWEGTTGIEPIDITIHKLLESSYLHHIERLMILGNFMMLCEFDPDEVYKWFMELFIDAYDWVMVPNVYGMITAADGGLMMTKPYISSSNYLMKMGSFKKGPWQQTWDALFWRFMHVHRNYFKSNTRMGMLLSHWDRMTKAKQEEHLSVANSFLKSLDK